MGNSIGGKKRTAKVMKIDGTTFRPKPPTQAGDVLRDHPGYTLLESEEVKRLGLRARPLEPETPLKPGRLYFLVELPCRPDLRVPRRAWSGALHMSAKERLESLVLSRRSVSDLTPTKPSSVEAVTDGMVRLRVRLPKSQVAKLMEESKDCAEAAEKIMEFCVSKDSNTAKAAAAVPPSAKTRRKEKRTRFVALPDEIIT
ncbi:uncharacterized protein At1g66480-like [Phoenix dactylifera]|uniref:Uncharacterized protein At1g66480-like n=1 Tax=Phoenix dactylifera TaxID=42345 RepID=A0A8B9APM9_PHODC|nr:uncharacterized protein At1g66480-like [Phoenix dactylifera]